MTIDVKNFFKSLANYLHIITTVLLALYLPDLPLNRNTCQNTKPYGFDYFKTLLQDL